MLKHVKITTLELFLDLIYPCKCRGCGKVGVPLCLRCKKYITRFNQGYRIGNMFVGGNRDGIISQMIIDYKYGGKVDLARALAEIMADSIILNGGIEGETIVASLPTIVKHIRERGFDHSLLLGRELAKFLGCKNEVIFERLNSTVQVGASKEKRIEQASSAYGLVGDIDTNKAYLLVDDIYTTGASMNAAENLLREAGVHKIYKTVIAQSNRQNDEDLEELI